MHKVNKVLICSAVSILFANTAYAADKESVCNATGVNGIKTESIFPTIGNPHCEVSLTEDVLDKINNSANNANNAISAAGNAQTVANNANTTANNALNTANEAKDLANKSKNTNSAGNNIKVNSSNNSDGSTNYEITTADDVNFNSVGSNSIQTGSVIIDREKTDADGHTIIQGVGQGSVNAGSNEVVNGGQLWQVQQEAKNEINKIKSGQSGLILTDGKTTTIDKAGTSSVIDITGANGDRILTGVANGVNPNDAVNVSQLQDYQQQNSNRLNTLNNKIDHNRKVSSQGIASVAAMSIEYPQQEPGHVATGIGFGTYDGENAIGWGINYLAQTGKTKIYGGVAQAFGSGTHAVGKVGISFVF